MFGQYSTGDADVEVPVGSASTVAVGDVDSVSAGGAAALGLSIGTKPTAPHQVESREVRHIGAYRLIGFVGASYAGLKKINVVKQPRVGGGRRNVCTGFSRGSRRSMQRLVSQLKTSSVQSGLFVTLTYPSQFPDGAKAKRDLDAFLKRLRREYPDVGGLWKLEPQQRGAPHFHLIILGVGYIPYKWVARAWFEVVGSGDDDHLKAGTEVRRVKSYQHAVHYVSKYIAKPTDAYADGDGLGEVGRRWGKFGAWRMHLGEVVSLALDTHEAAKLARIMDKKRLARARQILRPAARKRAIIKSRRRRALGLSQYWLGSPDVVLANLMSIIGRQSSV